MTLTSTEKQCFIIFITLFLIKIITEIMSPYCSESLARNNQTNEKYLILSKLIGLLNINVHQFIGNCHSHDRRRTQEK